MQSSPTTQAEIDALRDRQDQSSCIAFGVCYVFLFLIVVVPYGIYFAFGLCCFVMYFGLTTPREDP
jgi:hypothetical protein